MIPRRRAADKGSLRPRLAGTLGDMFFSQSSARDPRRARPEPLVGSGSVIVGADAVRDARPQGFHARITAHAGGGAYGFARVDDLGFAAVEGDAAAFGDGVDLPAQEITGRTDVPIDGTAVVWLEPLRGALGYGFRYASASAGAGTIGDAISWVASGVSLTADNTWFTFPSGTSGAFVPATGTYVVSAAIQMSGTIAVGTGLLVGRVYNLTRGQELMVSGVPVSRFLVGTCCVPDVTQHFFNSGFFNAVQLFVGEELVIQGCRSLYSPGSAWSAAQPPTIGFMPFASFLVNPLNRGTIGLLKVG